MEVRNKTDATRVLYKVYRCLEDHDLVVRLNRKLPVYGQVIRDWTQARTLMELNPRKKDWVATMLHEALHLVDWDLKESEISTLERDTFEFLTDRQLGNLIKRIIGCMRKSQ